MMCRRWVPLVTLTSRQKMISGGLLVGRKVSGSLAGRDKAINNLLPHRTARSPLCVCRNMTWEFFRTRFPVQMWQRERERENREMQLLVPRRMRERETGGKEKHQTSAGTAGSRESSVTERHRETETDLENRFAEIIIVTRIAVSFSPLSLSVKTG